MERRCLVTGGCGFIGSHLTEALLARGDRVTVADDLSTGSFENLANVADHPRLTFVEGCLSDAGIVRELLADVDCVYHLAAAVGVALIAREPLQTIERNIYPTQLLLDEACRLQAGRRRLRFFLASTSEVYGKNPKPIWNEDDDLVLGATTRPRWSYGASKAIDEFLALACFRQFRLPVVVGRFFNVVGPRQTGRYGMVLPRFVDAAIQGRPLIVHDDGQQQRCFAHVNDVVQSVVSLVDAAATDGKIFNIGCDQPISIMQLAQRVIAAVGSSSTIACQSYSEAYDADFEDVRRRVPDLTRLRQAIGYQPAYALDDIIADVITDRRQTLARRP